MRGVLSAHQGTLVMVMHMAGSPRQLKLRTNVIKRITIIAFTTHEAARSSGSRKMLPTSHVFSSWSPHLLCLLFAVMWR